MDDSKQLFCVRPAMEASADRKRDNSTMDAAARSANESVSPVWTETLMPAFRTGTGGAAQGHSDNACASDRLVKANASAVAGASGANK